MLIFFGGGRIIFSFHYMYFLDLVNLSLVFRELFFVLFPMQWEAFCPVSIPILGCHGQPPPIQLFT